MRGALLALFPLAVHGDCWDLQHPGNPRPELLKPDPSGWRRPAWSAVAPTEPAPPPLPPAARVCDVTAFGGKGDARTLNTAAIAAAIASCSSSSSNDSSSGQPRRVVLLPGPGVYLSGLVDLSHTTALTLELGEGAVLRSALGVADWPAGSLPDPDHGAPQYAPFIFAANATDVAIVSSGGGAVELNGHDWWAPKCAGEPTPTGAVRPFAVRFDGCAGVRVEGITVLNPPFWAVVPTRSRRVRFHNASIVAPAWSPNTDGFEPLGCSDVAVTGCFVSNGDDCVTIKVGCEAMASASSYFYSLTHTLTPPLLVSTHPSTCSLLAGIKGGCDGVVVADSYFAFGHGATIGSVTDHGVRNVRFSNIVLNATTDAMQIKGHSNSLPAVVDSVLYENIRFFNLTAIHDTHHDPAMAVSGGVAEWWSGGGALGHSSHARLPSSLRLSTRCFHCSMIATHPAH